MNTRSILYNILKSNYFTLIILFISIYFFTIEGSYGHKGLLLKTYETIRLFTYDSSENFYTEISKLGVTNYTTKDNLNVSANNDNDNVFLILESFENTYFDTTFSNLVPYMQKLKQDWTYIDIKQNIGSNWTIGSFYTLLTGMPAFFGGRGNSIFQSSYHTNITALTDVLKFLRHNLVHISKNANFAFTREMLSIFGFNKIIDGNAVNPGFDRDLFEKLKEEIKYYKRNNKKFSIFVSTLDTHAPGKYDNRFSNTYGALSDLEYPVKILDSLIQNFIIFLANEKYFETTNIFILPDHKYMSKPKIFKNHKDGDLFILTNVNRSNNDYLNKNIYQVNLPELILSLSGITHNVTFISNYFKSPINEYINNNISQITSINMSGISRSGFPLINNSNLVDNTSITNHNLIAHGGGGIDGYIYTNSLEALNNSYDNGFRLFELDINLTSDNQLVAVHRWQEWNFIINNKWDPRPPTHQEFMENKIHNSYTPLDMEVINQWFREHTNAFLITDKINNPYQVSSNFDFNDRLIMELFSCDSIVSAQQIGIDYIISKTVLKQLLIQNKLDHLYNKNIAFDYHYGLKNYKTLMKLKEHNTKFYIYGINTYSPGHAGLSLNPKDGGIVIYNEQFVIENNLFGSNAYIYADKFFTPTDKKR